MLLEVRNVTKKYGGIIALKNITISIDSNDILGIIGPNGAGKTTLVNVITGVMPRGVPRPPDEGQIFFRGTNITHLPAWKIARLGITRTFQTVRCFETLSVQDNIMLGGWDFPENIRRSRAKCLIECFSLEQYSTQQMFSVPLGIRKRAEIARALMRNPLLIFLDEPFAGLTSDEVRKIMNGINEILDTPNTTLVIIEHRIQELCEYVKRLVVLDHGRVIASGSPVECLQSELVIRAYLGSGAADVETGQSM